MVEIRKIVKTQRRIQLPKLFKEGDVVLIKKIAIKGEKDE